MNERVAAWVRAEAQPRRSLPRLNQTERATLVAMLRAARDAGATLANRGRGGLSPSLVFGIFRRDEWRCKRCQGSTELLVHHKGGIHDSPWLVSKGKQNTPNNLVVLCKRCHSSLHGQDQ